MGMLSFIFAVIVFCVFIGMFMRLGRIETLLEKIAIHQGAIGGVVKSVGGGKFYSPVK